MNTKSKTFLKGFLAGVFVTIMLAVVVSLATYEGGIITPYPENIEYIYDIDLLEYEERKGDIYIKYKNNSDVDIYACAFVVKIYADEQLVIEASAVHTATLSPNEITEGVIPAINRNVRGWPRIDLNGKKFVVEVIYAFKTQKPIKDV